MRRARRLSSFVRTHLHWTLDPAGRVYVQRRSEAKDVYPGYYDVIAGGVNDVGESYDACAAREIERERFCPDSLEVFERWRREVQVEV